MIPLRRERMLQILIIFIENQQLTLLVNPLLLSFRKFSFFNVEAKLTD